MADHFVRVCLSEGDEQQLVDLAEDDYIEFEGSINGAPVAVRFYRAEGDSGEGPESPRAELARWTGGES